MRSMAIVDDSPTQRGCGERAIPVTGVTTTRVMVTSTVTGVAEYVTPVTVVVTESQFVSARRHRQLQPHQARHPRACRTPTR